MRQLNARITKTLPCEGDKHPVFHPHCTIAYVKKGSCDQLVGQDPFAAEGSPGAEFVAYGMLFKGASDVEDDPLRVKEHLLFNKEKKPEPPLDELPVQESGDGVAKDFILDQPGYKGFYVKMAYADVMPELKIPNLYFGEYGRMELEPKLVYPPGTEQENLKRLGDYVREKYGSGALTCLKTEPVYAAAENSA